MVLTGTSIFDPVLSEVIYNWFCIRGGKVFDPFAGGSVRGVVASLCGLDYSGIDLSEKQTNANRGISDALGVSPVWYCDDSRNADKYIVDNSADLVFSCPPYFDLEQYSDDPRDLSNMDYADFLTAYNEIISLSCRKLKENRFAVFVVGDIRNKLGVYRDFIGDTKRAFFNNGLSLYNDVVFLEQYGTAPMRAGTQFDRGRKLVKVHQNILIFYKGDPRKVKEIFNEPFQFADLEQFNKG